MKQALYLITMMTLVFVVQGFAQKRAAQHDLEFKRYDDSYFEKNNSGLTGKTSYLVITSQEEFDKVFGPAATMGHNNFLPDKTFDTKFVIAAIKRGNSLREYDVAKVTATKGRLYVWYRVKYGEEGSASFRSPLILAVAKGKYSQIVFMENGRRARTIAASSSNSASLPAINSAKWRSAAHIAYAPYK